MKKENLALIAILHIGGNREKHGGRERVEREEKRKLGRWRDNKKRKLSVVNDIEFAVAYACDFYVYCAVNVFHCDCQTSQNIKL